MEITDNGGQFVGEVYDNGYTPIEAAKEWCREYYGGNRVINDAEFTQVKDKYYFMIEDGVSTYRMIYKRGTPGLLYPRWMVWRI